jgi:Uma2 family endonuclease
LLGLPPDAAWEVLAGELVEKAAPSFAHGQAQRSVGARLDGFARRSGKRAPGGWWLATEVDVEYDLHDVYRHDVVGWRRERAPEAPADRPVKLLPDWVCEILSPSNWANDTVVKFRVLQQKGVPFYWVIDLEHRVLTVYELAGSTYKVAAVAGPGERARLVPFDALELEVATLFGDDPSDEGESAP